MRIVCLIVAAGRGTRARNVDGIAKQYQHIGAVPILKHAIRAFDTHPQIDSIHVVIHKDDAAAYESATTGVAKLAWPPILGGETRQESVRAGLEALKDVAPDYVLIHDAARPFVQHDVIDRTLDALEHNICVIPTLAVADTLKRTSAGMFVGSTIPRNGIFRAQTPQGFRFAPILEAHRAAFEGGRTDFTDDAAVAEWRGMRIAMVAGAEANRKITTFDDIRLADIELREGMLGGQVRKSGTARESYGVIDAARSLLCGCRISNREGGGEGENGDLAAPVIGRALARAVELRVDPAQLPEIARQIRSIGGGIVSVSLTVDWKSESFDVIRPRMRNWIAESLWIDLWRVNVEVGETERQATPGSRDGISIFAHVLVNMPEFVDTRDPERPAPRADRPVPNAKPEHDTWAQKTRILDTLRSPDDLRRMSDESLPAIAAEVRQEVIDAVSSTGGHLGSSLGVVELTVALHKVFDTPRDRLIFDVGHQAYPHKILTGRREKIRTLRQAGGLSGFTKRSESEFDPFGAAHSSTSISAGLGMAVARDLQGEKNNIVCVIGDGAMSAGMAYEAMNNAGIRKERLIVVLNDNAMSIAPPVGSISAYLARLSSSATYFYLRDAARQLARKLPRGWERRAARAEELTRTYWTGGTLFEELGFHYVGPIDGHDFSHLLPVLRNVRDADAGPILVHVVTQKGKGYAPAEAAADKYHGVGKFDVVTGAQAMARSNAPSYTRVFAESLIEEARREKRIVAVTAAMPSGTGLDIFEKAFPSRTFDVGIAEQHAVTFAAGLAAEGMKPFVAIYSTFLQRAYDQIVHDVAIQGLPVRFVIDRAGLVGADGPTHAGSFDIAYLSCLPGMVIMAAADEAELRHMLTTQVALDSGPSALRFPRGDGVGVELPSHGIPLEIGRGRIVRQGRRVALLSLGTRLTECLKAADTLAARGIDATVADARFAKPLDTILIGRLAAEHEILLTIEEGSIGGFGSHVLQFLSDENLLDGSLKFRALVLPDRFIDQDLPERMYAAAGLDANTIVSKVISLCDSGLKTGSYK